MKTFRNISLFICLLSLSNCKKSDWWATNGPMDIYLAKKWKLVKVESPNSASKVGSQIGFVEVLEPANDPINTFDRTIRDGVIVYDFLWDRSRPPVVDKSKMTVSFFYQPRKIRRDIKIEITDNDPEKSMLIASAYLDEGLNQPDTVTYYYTIYK